ncbi:MAG: VacJ family lipoprotein [Syntrophus sp. (in: bacteria)]|nr:VacJ family lipoprotein [Syntrophus sp. (in: bacteria)]
MVRAMKWFISALLLPAVLSAGCAHSPYATSFPAPSAAPPLPRQVAIAPGPERLPQQSPEISAKSGDESPLVIKKAVKEETAALSPPPESVKSNTEMPTKSANKSITDQEFLDYTEGEDEEKKIGIADPLEPFNRAMYHFNDKLYFWVLKPMAQGYRKVVPEKARIGVGNFFANITFPIRFVNCLLQANIEGAASELGRFVINTLWGIGGILDLASHKDINLSRQDEDFGQTLGVFGLGQGFYINWPLLGPSSPRDTLGWAADFYVHPFSYLTTWDVFLGISVYERINDTSLSIGDYESLKEAAIDPYVAIRDAYVQYRQKKVKDRGVQPEPPKPQGTLSPAVEEASP